MKIKDQNELREEIEKIIARVFAADSVPAMRKATQNVVEMKDDLEKARQGCLFEHRGDSGGKLGRPSHGERQCRDHLGALKRDDKESEDCVES